MKQAQWLREGIVSGRPFYLDRQNVYLHNLLNLGLLVLNISLWLGIAFAKKLIPAPVYIPLASLAFGYVFNLNSVLVIHEASHNLFIASKNKERAEFWNNFFGWFISLPGGTDFHNQWEKGHIQHHLHIAEKVDPESCRPQTGKPLLKKLAKILFCPGYIHYLAMGRGQGFSYECDGGKKIKFNGPLILGVLALWTLFFFLAKPFGSTSGLLIVAIAMFLGLQVSWALSTIRESLEHGGIKISKDNLFLRTRTTLSLFRYLFQPYGEYYHYEHHLNSHIPWYNLKKYHKVLKGITPPPLRPYIYTVGLRETVQQLLGRKASIPSELAIL